MRRISCKERSTHKSALSRTGRSCSKATVTPIRDSRPTGALAFPPEVHSPASNLMKHKLVQHEQKPKTPTKPKRDGGRDVWAAVDPPQTPSIMLCERLCAPMPG